MTCSSVCSRPSRATTCTPTGKPSLPASVAAAARSTGSSETARLVVSEARTRVTGTLAAGRSNRLASRQGNAARISRAAVPCLSAGSAETGKTAASRPCLRRQLSSNCPSDSRARSSCCSSSAYRGPVLRTAAASMPRPASYATVANSGRCHRGSPPSRHSSATCSIGGEPLSRLRIEAPPSLLTSAR